MCFLTKIFSKKKQRARKGRTNGNAGASGRSYPFTPDNDSSRTDSITVNPAITAQPDSDAARVEPKTGLGEPRDVVVPEPEDEKPSLPYPDAAQTAQAPQTAQTAQAAQTAQTAYPSNAPIIIGTPTIKFEPRYVKNDVYSGVLHRADTVIDGWETDSIRVRAATVRGYSHRYDGSPRQDDFALAILPECGWLVAAVADGVSSARQSHIGSSEALRFVTSWLAASKPGSLTEINWKALVDGAAWHLVETARKLLQDPGADAKAAEKEVATTLICAVVAPGAEGFEASVIGIGDSGVWLLGSEGFSKVKGGKAEASGGISSSAVNGLPQVPTEIVSVSVAVKSGQALLLGTDGFGDPLGDGDGLVGGLFKRGLIDSVPSLIEFAHMLDFSRETFDDDRTLVAIWPKIPASTKEGQPAQPTALAPIPDSSLAVAHQRPEHKTEVGRR